MTSAISRAREAAMAGGGGDYLDNDTLIANQLVFYIIDVVDDRGGGFNGNDRWQVKVEPFYDEEQDPNGIVTLNDNPARRKFMDILNQELDQKDKAGDDPVIGPCCLVKLKGRNYRYIEIVDWDETNRKPILPQGAVLAGRVEEEVRVRRPRQGMAPAPAQTESEPEEATRPFVEAVEAKAEPSPAAVPAQQEPAAKEPSASVRRRRTVQEATSEFPTIKVWAQAHGYDVDPNKRGRVSNEIKAAYEKAKEDAGLGDESEPEPISSPRRRVRQEMAAPEAPETPHTRPAQVGAGAPRRAVNPAVGEAYSAQELSFQPGAQGRTLEPCSACGQHIQDRVFPTGVAGKYALIHTGCVAGGEQQVMDAELIAE